MEAGGEARRRDGAMAPIERGTVGDRVSRPIGRRHARARLVRNVAEGAGFEPAVRLHAHTLSKRAP